MYEADYKKSKGIIINQKMRVQELIEENKMMKKRLDQLEEEKKEGDLRK